MWSRHMPRYQLGKVLEACEDGGEDGGDGDGDGDEGHQV